MPDDDYRTIQKGNYIMIQINPDKFINIKIENFVDTYNDHPDPQLGNLSPNQVHKLIHLPWDDPDYPIKFNKELKMPDLKRVSHS